MAELSVVAIKNKLEAKKKLLVFQERAKAARRIMLAYQGKYSKLRALEQGEILGTDLSEGILTTREEVVCNLLNTIVDGNVAKLGMLPEINVVIPYPANDEKVAFAEKIERIIYAYWASSNMVRKMAVAAFDSSTLGTAVFSVHPDFQTKLPMIEVRDPSTVYPEPEYGKDYSFLDNCIFSWKEYSFVINREFGTNFETEEVEVIEYIDKQHRILIVEDDILARVRHNYKFCPVVIIQNIVQPRTPFGSSDIEQVIGLNQYAIHLFNLERYGLEEVLFSPIILIDPLKAPEELELGPDAVWGVHAGGGATRLPPVSTPPNLDAQLARTFNLIFRGTAYGPAEFGETAVTSVGTGKFQTALRSPLGERLEFKRGLWGEALCRLNTMCLKIDEMEWGDVEKEVFGRDLRSKYAIRYKPKEDINGWYENEVIWSPWGADLPTQLTTLLMASGQKIVSKDFVRQHIRGIRDPEEEARRIEEETARELKFTQEMALAARGEYAPEEIEREALAIERGKIGGGERAAPPPAPPPLPPEFLGVAPTPAPTFSPVPFEMLPEIGGFRFEDVIRMFREGLPKSQGRIFLIGELVEEGASDVVEIALTDLVDKRAILDALPDLYGFIKFSKVMDEPDQPFVEVTPGGEEEWVEER